MSAPHARDDNSGRRLLLSLVFTAGFAVVEAVGGWLAGSLALLSDAGHMITDSAALAFGAVAAWAARHPPTQRHSFGLQRAEVVGALVNALIMVGVVVYIGVAALERFSEPVPVRGGMVVLIAAIGLLVNAVVAWTLQHGEQTMNTRGALLHVMGDLLGSVAALLSGLVIAFTGWTPIDPILSLFISLLILASSLRLLWEVLHVFMEGVPPDIDLDEVGHRMTDVDGVREVHDLHIWGLSSRKRYLSAHIVVAGMEQWARIHRDLENMLARDFDLTHVTLQPEPASRQVRAPGDPFTISHQPH